MRTPRLLIVLALAAPAALGQALEPLDLPPNASMAGPGAITASPTRPAADTAHTGKHALPTRSTRGLARMLGNGTSMSYGEAGANAIGNTGGLTTGPLGSAGAVAGGGGVHSGALVIPPGQANGSMHSDEMREHLAQPSSQQQSSQQP